MSSFEQTKMGWSPQYCIPCFVEIGPPVPEEEISKGFYHIYMIYRCGCHLGHVTSIMSSDFHFLELKSFHTIVSEKIQFEFLYVPDLGPRSRNDLDLQYS